LIYYESSQNYTVESQTYPSPVPPTWMLSERVIIAYLQRRPRLRFGLWLGLWNILIHLSHQSGFSLITVLLLSEFKIYLIIHLFFWSNAPEWNRLGCQFFWYKRRGIWVPRLWRIPIATSAFLSTLIYSWFGYLYDRPFFRLF
jgi:hypothetical protein